MKKGQITIFIIIAILIISVIAIFFIFRNQIVSTKESIPEEASPIYDYVKSCIKQTASDGVYLISSKGGYWITPEYAVKTEEAYYIFKNKSVFPSKEKIESEIGLFIRDNIKYCLNNFKTFPSFNISTRTLSAKTSLKPDKFAIDVTYPILLKKGDFSYEFSDFKNIIIPTNAGFLYDIALNYSNTYLETNGFSLTYAAQLKNSGVITTFEYFPNYTIIDLYYNSTTLDEWRFTLG